jgi:hypothetical protein
VLFDQILQRKGLKCRVWLKSASINYLKPGRTDLEFTISLSEDEISEAMETLTSAGKFVKAFTINMYDSNGEHCVTVINEVYVRNLFKGEEQSIAY